MIFYQVAPDGRVINPCLVESLKSCLLMMPGRPDDPEGATEITMASGARVVVPSPVGEVRREVQARANAT